MIIAVNCHKNHTGCSLFFLREVSDEKYKYLNDIHSYADDENDGEGATTTTIVATEVTRTAAPSTAPLPRFLSFSSFTSI